MSHIIPLFSKPIYYSFIEPITKEELDFIKKMEYCYMNTTNLSEWTKSKKVLNFNSLNRLKQEIDNHIRIYTKDILSVSNNQEFYITHSWIVKQQKDAFAMNHSHVNSLISGVMYLEVFDGNGSIRFNEQQSLFPSTIEIEYDNHSELNSKNWYIPAENNKIILFPSTVWHDITPNKSDNVRYSLAFNCFVRGKFGKDEYELHLP